MQCDQFERILEQQDDAQLSKPALDHIDACEACRGLALDLNMIHDIAMELGAEGIAPPEHVWISLRNRLETEGILHEPRLMPEITRAGWWTALQRPALAGSFLASILVAASMITYQWSSPQRTAPSQFAIQQKSSPILSADNAFEQEMATVGSDAIPELRTQDAAVADSIRKNLGVVDNFIAMCEKSVREQPDNEMAREYLYGAYQQKAELLATAMNRSMAGGLQ